MRPTASAGSGPHVAAQVSAAFAALEKAARDSSLARGLADRDRAFLEAVAEMDVVRRFVGSPEHILGSPDTKHGEIAEQVHVGVSRAWSALLGEAPTATFDGVGRTGAADYVDGVPVQSKYINGLRNGLDHMIRHAEKYPEFAQGDTRYHIPSDQQVQLEQLRATGAIDGLSDRSVRAVARKLGEFEALTGRDAGEVIQAGEGTYAEVQQGRVHETLDQRESSMQAKNDELNEQLRDDHGTGLGGFAQAAIAGGIAGSGVRIGQAIFVKYREGKNPFTDGFTGEDWADVGVQGAKGAGAGAVAGGALYAVTNATDLAAPFAGSLVSAFMGIGGLLRAKQAGDIDADEFVELSHLAATDAAIVGLAAAGGQALVPIPMLGAFVGSLAGKVVASALREGLADSEAELLRRLKAYEEQALARLDAECRRWLTALDSHFGNLERLARVAFDLSVNTRLRLDASVRFAVAVGVPEDQIMKSADELDLFMQE